MAVANFSRFRSFFAGLAASIFRTHNISSESGNMFPPLKYKKTDRN